MSIWKHLVALLGRPAANEAKSAATAASFVGDEQDKASAAIAGGTGKTSSTYPPEIGLALSIICPLCGAGLAVLSGTNQQDRERSITLRRRMKCPCGTETVELATICRRHLPAGDLVRPGMVANRRLVQAAEAAVWRAIDENMRLSRETRSMQFQKGGPMP